MRKTLFAFIMMSGCQGVPINGFDNPPNVWILPACLFFCTTHLGKEDVVSNNSPGSTSGGGITSSSASTSGGNTVSGGN